MYHFIKSFAVKKYLPGDSKRQDKRPPFRKLQRNQHDSENANNRFIST